MAALRISAWLQQSRDCRLRHVFEPNGQNTSSNKPDVFDYVRSVDLTPRVPETAQVGVANGGRAPRAESYYGEPPRVQGAAPATTGGDGYELNFDNAPVTTVAKVILGDILGSGYTIDPRVQGTVSLSSGQPVQKGDLLFVLESALRLSNVAMVKDVSGYRLLPLSEAVGPDASTPAVRSRDFGIRAIPNRTKQQGDDPAACVAGLEEPRDHGARGAAGTRPEDGRPSLRRACLRSPPMASWASVRGDVAVWAVAHPRRGLDPVRPCVIACSSSVSSPVRSPT